jgi:hypothetical protein
LGPAIYRTSLFATRQAARTAVFEFIEMFCNRQRLQSSLSYRTTYTVLVFYTFDLETRPVEGDRLDVIAFLVASTSHQSTILHLHLKGGKTVKTGQVHTIF